MFKKLAVFVSMLVLFLVAGISVCAATTLDRGGGGIPQFSLNLDKAFVLACGVASFDLDELLGEPMVQFNDDYPDWSIVTSVNFTTLNNGSPIGSPEVLAAHYCTKPINAG